MQAVEELIDKLARDALDASNRLGDDKFIDQVAATLEASSSTAHELFMTYIRVYRAESRARDMLEAVEKKIAATRIESQ